MQHLKAVLESIPFEVINPLEDEFIGLLRIPSEKGCIEFVDLKEGTYQAHIHDTIDAFLVILSGSGHILLNGEVQPFHPGDTFQVPKGTSHGFTILERTILLSIQDKPILDQETQQADIRLDFLS